MVDGALPALPASSGDPADDSARCGDRGYRTIDDLRWEDDGYEFYINDVNNPHGTQTTERLKDGFRTWNNTLDACNSRKRDTWRTTYKGIDRNTSISNTDDNVNMVGFSTGPEVRKKCKESGESSPGTVYVACRVGEWKHKWLNQGPRYIVKADIIFNAGDGVKRWSKRLIDGCVFPRYDVWNVATHEAGHALGLTHIEDTGSVMDPTVVECDDDRRILGRGDVRGIRHLY